MQGAFLKRLGLLLKEGYSLNEACSFLLYIEQGAAYQWADMIEKQMKEGHSLHQILEQCHFSPLICTQIYLGSLYGNFEQKIIHCGEWLLKKHERHKKFKKVIHYPAILVAFMGGMILLMRFILLPQIEMLIKNQMDELDMTTRILLSLIRLSPYWMSTAVFGALLACYLFEVNFKKKAVLARLTFLLKVPILNKYLRLYWTDFYFMQWSEMLKSGCSLYEMIQIAQSKDSTAMLKEIGTILEKNMRQGHSFSQSLAALPFLSKEARSVVRHGEETGNLATEMYIYHLKCADEFEQRFERMLENIQPIVFVVIAVLIVGIYAALMLPTFKMMEVL
ncbi:competence type IV pilus assembly protein ComGB [Allofustis seminis]|uniref:competence type IV pilus assembly protein ComGB n=1 Tax=Allofustis seminis TaxID=166939 RepID=UPI0024814844|nr:competence type IV pilus assembly protein ComGB [Allofustis seminis]